MGLNAFGGIKRWVAAPGAEWWILGNAASGGESLLSAFTGGTVGAISSHIEYEPL
jgi:ABC-type molybdenum transport system ATPase subunit/photorepair protein PhrA